jgi:hypothetical protein
LRAVASISISNAKSRATAEVSRGFTLLGISRQSAFIHREFVMLGTSLESGDSLFQAMEDTSRRRAYLELIYTTVAMATHLQIPSAFRTKFMDDIDRTNLKSIVGELLLSVLLELDGRLLVERLSDLLPAEDKRDVRERPGCGMDAAPCTHTRMHAQPHARTKRGQRSSHPWLPSTFVNQSMGMGHNFYFCIEIIDSVGITLCDSISTLVMWESNPQTY